MSDDVLNYADLRYWSNWVTFARNNNVPEAEHVHTKEQAEVLSINNHDMFAVFNAVEKMRRR